MLKFLFACFATATAKRKSEIRNEHLSSLRGCQTRTKEDTGMRISPLNRSQEALYNEIINDLFEEAENN